MDASRGAVQRFSTGLFIAFYVCSCDRDRAGPSAAGAMSGTSKTTPSAAPTALSSAPMCPSSSSAAPSPPWQQLTRAPLPDAASIADARIEPFMPGQPMSLEDFRSLIVRARVVDPCDSSVGAWQYSPQHSGSFQAKDGRWSVQLFLGGRGVVTSPRGEKIMFDVVTK